MIREYSRVIGIRNELKRRQLELSTTAEDSNRNAFEATSMILILKKVCDSSVTSVVLQKVWSEGFKILLILSTSLVALAANVSVIIISDS